MSDTLIVLHTAIAIIAIVLLIVVVKVDPVISLVIGTLYLGVAAGLGFEDTIGTFVQGFGDIMAEVGLLIGFGVLMGTLLTAMGALQKLVELLLRILGPRRLPYAFSAALSYHLPGHLRGRTTCAGVPSGSIGCSPNGPQRARDDGRDADRRHTCRIRVRRPGFGNRGDSGIAGCTAGHDVDLRNCDRSSYSRTYHVYLRPDSETRAMEQCQG